ncbi:MAG: DNA repair protein RadA [Bacteroidetes bacterium]|nr:MAG: DNA repair protein RadA [Bacteroidota bacterium]REK04809.1 MAG: DNA repair protein RadA [Bacteroidota bacterium]REK36282.1 MAG: DNA repair protein RadA [Bacteroidota bacterium]REK51054.1 MAG: DNA repair protein RadA [Bacteroidota bacterium]
MPKVKTAFFCQNCGLQSPKWVGRCTSCGQWNTYVEEIVEKEEKPAWKVSSGKVEKSSKPLLLSEIQDGKEERIKLPDQELNRVLGGGLVNGSLVLMGGEPGIGKSTLLLQLALKLNQRTVLYVSGEESELQIKMRADRLSLKNDSMLVMTETSLENIFKHISALQPGLVIIDSIQTMFSSKIDSSPGSVSQIRECTAELLRFAKESSTPVLLIGHITKDGMIAGPKILEHMVDTVLQFEGDRNHVYRVLRSVKNRFGSTAELGIYEMQGSGLREVHNPSEILIAQREELLSGVAIAATMDGARPLLIETQALVSSAVYGTPQRSSTGFDLRRMSMLLAVLEKRCGFRLGVKDVFLNIAGGIKVEDPAIDLAVICAVLSSNEDIAISPKICFSAEVGLSGEIRPVTRIENRISEAEKMGFEQVIISKYNLKGLDQSRFKKIKLTAVAKVEEVFSILFG